MSQFSNTSTPLNPATKATLPTTAATTTSTQGEGCVRIPIENPGNVQVRQQAPILHQTTQAPIVAEVVEKQQHNVVKQNLITEVKQKPSVQIVEQPIIKNVKEAAVVTKTNLGTIEENLVSKQAVANPYAGRQTQHRVEAGTTMTTQAPTVKQIIEQPVQAIVNQPVISEVHEKQFVEVQQQNIIRKTTDAPTVTVTKQAPLVVNEVRGPQLCSTLPASEKVTQATATSVKTVPVVPVVPVVQKPLMKEVVEEVHQVTHPRGTAPPIPANAEVISSTYKGAGATDSTAGGKKGMFK